MIFILEKTRILNGFSLDALSIATRYKYVHKLNNSLEANYHNSQCNPDTRNKARTVQSFYNQSAIDIAAAKVVKYYSKKVYAFFPICIFSFNYLQIKIF